MMPSVAPCSLAPGRLSNNAGCPTDANHARTPSTQAAPCVGPPSAGTVRRLARPPPPFAVPTGAMMFDRGAQRAAALCMRSLSRPASQTCRRLRARGTSTRGLRRRRRRRRGRRRPSSPSSTLSPRPRSAATPPPVRRPGGCRLEHAHPCLQTQWSCWLRSRPFRATSSASRWPRSSTSPRRRLWCAAQMGLAML